MMNENKQKMKHSAARRIGTAILSLAVLFSFMPALGDLTDGKIGAATASAADSMSALSMSNWSYNSNYDVYYQTGLTYCSSPADTSYETLGIYVPGAYFNGTKNSSGTYTCTINTSGTKGDYTASTAPIVIPVNTPGYSYMSPPSSSTSIPSTYTDEGIIYLYAGCRGRQNAGAPAGVTDLKAAIRYYRYYAAEGSLPGDTDNIYSFGHSGGGAQSALLGASGDSSLYTSYLTAIGAVTKDSSGNTISDAIAGSMCWCPITNLDVADAAYEWNMGLTRSSLSSDAATLSKGLAANFATYINKIGFTSDGTTLALSSTSDGYYQSGTYYDYVLGVVSTSLNNYLQDTYSSTSDRASYVKKLDSDGSWVTYSSSTDTATVTNLEEFATDIKSATKTTMGAFDNVADVSAKGGSAENQLFGQSGSYSHFNSDLADLIQNNSTYSSYYSDFTSDLAVTDGQGNSIATRLNMYNPVYYLDDYYAGYDTSTVAKYWRIRSGITQGDTSLCTEIDLALALENSSQVDDVDFATVWAQGHTEAERSSENGGDNNANFIAWVADCVSSSSSTKKDQTVTFSESSVSKTYGDEAFTNTASTSGDGTITYSSSDTSVATVGSSTGKVTIVGAGTATITATAAETDTYNEGSASYTLTVAQASNTITLSSNSTVALKTGNTSQISASVTDGTLSYESSDTSVATVDSSGKITAVGTGKATITINGTPSSSNYAAPAAVTVAVTVTSKTVVTLTVTQEDTTYGTELPDASVLSGSLPSGVSEADLTYYNTGTTESGVSYSSTEKPTEAGSYTLTVSYDGDSEYYYEGSTSFTISQLPVTITANDQTISYGTSISSETTDVTTGDLADGDSLSSITLTASTTDVTTSGTITPSDAVIKSGSDDMTSNYNITYAAGSLTITASSSGSSSAATVTIVQDLKAVKGFKLTKGKKKFTAKWTKPKAGVRKTYTGYEIQYATNSSFTDAVSVYAGKNAKSKAVKKLKSKKKYYVRIRAYRNDGSTIHVSKWTKKTVKTK